MTPTFSTATPFPTPAVGRYGRRPQRGVVLIFVVAVLVLLVILSTAFFSTVRSQGLLQANRRNSFQADLAAQSGINQAERHLNILGNPSAMPNSNVVVAYPADPNAATLNYGDGWSYDGFAGQWVLTPALHTANNATAANQAILPPNQFFADQLDEAAPWPPILPAVGGLDPTQFQWSWANFWVDDKDRNLRPIDRELPLIQPVVRNMTNTADIVVWPYFPRGSLEHSKTPGELEKLTAAWSMGRRWLITPNDVLARDRAPSPDYPGGRTDLEMFSGDPTLSDYNANFRYKLRAQQVLTPGYPLSLASNDNIASPPVTFSGFIDYRMVATDLDSRLYLPIDRWIPENLAATANNRLDPATGTGVANRRTILKTLSDEITFQINGSVYTGSSFLAPVYNNFAVDDGTGRLAVAHSWGDLWRIAADADPSMDIHTLVPGDMAGRQQYLFRKYLVPREFNIYPARFSADPAFGGNVLNAPKLPIDRPALNINTASREVLAANFAAVLQEDSIPASIGSVTADDLAVRIMRCRPFYSQIDWQDFLAANLEEQQFAIVYGNLDTRVITAIIRDSGGRKGIFDGSYILAIPNTDTTVGTAARMLWFRNQIAATGVARLRPKGFNALLSASLKSSSQSYYAKTATIVYEEDAGNPGNPQTTTASWTEGGVPKSLTIAKAKLASWTVGFQDGIFEWNFTTDPTLRPAWDTSGLYAYMVPSGGDLPDFWSGLDKAQPVIVAMPIKLRSYLFEIVVRARYIEFADHVPTVRAASKIHTVYDTLNKITWMREELHSDKGALSDP